MRHKRKGETSYKETAFGIIPRSKLIPLEIEGIKKAWDFVSKQHAEGRILITSHFLKKVHHVGFGWIFPEMGGRFRTIEVTVSGHKPPHAYQVAPMMQDFTEDLKIRIKHLMRLNHIDFLKEIIEFLAWAHHRFLWIHPFADYNGRIGRLLINMILLDLNLPPVELKVETKAGRARYIKALQRADKGDSIFLQNVIRSALEEAAKNLF